jgi:hypothetical protein
MSMELAALCISSCSTLLSSEAVLSRLLCDIHDFTPCYRLQKEHLVQRTWLPRYFAPCIFIRDCGWTRREQLGEVKAFKAFLASHPAARFIAIQHFVSWDFLRPCRRAVHTPSGAVGSYASRQVLPVSVEMSAFLLLRCASREFTRSLSDCALKGCSVAAPLLSTHRCPVAPPELHPSC